MDTGQAKWAMQTTPHDEWDYDATNEVILFENNKKTYATQINKNGFIYTWQANNGTLIAAEKVHPFVNWATGVDLRSGVPSKSAHANIHQDVNTNGICPSNIGAKGTNPVSYSPKTKLIYFPLSITCMSFEPVYSKYTVGQPWTGATVSNFNGALKAGGLFAFDLIEQKVVWQHDESVLINGGTLTTISNILYYGNLERVFKALDASTGKVLWQYQVGSGVIGDPFSYAYKGKQYVGIMSGIGGKWYYNYGIDRYLRPTDSRPPTPESKYRVEKSNAVFGGGALNVFSL